MKAGCGGCHVLKKAGASGQLGPNLDTLQPSYAQVVAQVTNGGGSMPSFKKSLTATQIRNVSAFVATTAGG